MGTLAMSMYCRPTAIIIHGMALILSTTSSVSLVYHCFFGWADGQQGSRRYWTAKKGGHPYIILRHWHLYCIIVCSWLFCRLARAEERRRRGLMVGGGIVYRSSMVIMMNSGATCCQVWSPYKNIEYHYPIKLREKSILAGGRSWEEGNSIGSCSRFVELYRSLNQ